MPTSDTDFDAYLSYLHIVSGKCLINGKPEYSFDLPKELSTTSLENLVYKRCEELKIDYVSPSNVHDRVIEAIRDYNQHKLDKKESNGDKDRGLTP